MARFAHTHGSVQFSRRHALGLAAGLAFGGSASRARAQAPHAGHGAEAGDVGQHNMLVFGERTVFLSHLPMFVGLDGSGARFATEHRFQLILEASFEAPRTRRDLTELYRQDQQQHPQVRMYTVRPGEMFALADIFRPAAAAPPRTSFPGDVFRGHLERNGDIIRGLGGATVRIARVVHAHEFRPGDTRPETLEYILFGKAGELFLAHRIVAPGDFDQVLPVRIPEQQFSDAELSQGIAVRVPGRPNAVASRLQGGRNAAAQVAAAGAQPRAITLQPRREIYFEEGELAVPATMRTTGAEKNAGF